MCCKHEAVPLLVAMAPKQRPRQHYVGRVFVLAGYVSGFQEAADVPRSKRLVASTSRTCSLFWLNMLQVQRKMPRSLRVDDTRTESTCISRRKASPGRVGNIQRTLSAMDGKLSPSGQPYTLKAESAEVVSPHFKVRILVEARAGG